MKPLISVYTPTYNRADLLMMRAIPSVLSQTYINFEYIIVSDGSTDRTREYVDLMDDDRIHFFEIERKRPHHNYDSTKDWCIGGAYAANLALEKAKGVWIARIDDDDIWTLDHLEKSFKFAQENDYEFITSRSNAFEPPLLQDYLKIFYKSKPNPHVGPHSSFFYRAYLKKYKYNPLCYRKRWNSVEDPDLLERLFLDNVRIGFLDEILTYIIPRPGLSEIGRNAIIEKRRQALRKA